MNAQMSSPVAPSKTRKVVLQFVMGLVSGAAAMAGVLYILDTEDGLLVAPGRPIAVGTAVVLCLMAVLVGLGAAMPRLGEKALNVEDADEISELRTPLLVGAGSFLLAALLIISLALVPGEGTSGLLSPHTATVLAGMAVIGMAFLGIRFRKLGDELNRAVSKEANGWALTFVFVLFGGWAALAQLGHAPMFAPLTFVAGLFASYLLAIFVAASLRGMLKPR